MHAKTTYLQVAMVLLALPLVAFHVVFKQHPDANEVAQLRNAMKRPAEWQGKLAPDFGLDLLEGSRFQLSDHVGHEVIVLNFFATWCGPCKAEMPELNRFQAQHHGQPILVVGVDAEEKRDLVAAFVSSVPVDFPVGIDGSGEVQKSLGVDSYPTTVLIGSDGRIQLYLAGAIANTDVAFSSLVEANLDAIRNNKGISKDAYLAALKSEHPPSPSSKGQPALTARAEQIATHMDCPCGCSDTLERCACSTSRKAKARLASLSLEGRKDADVMQQLNREFCMKGMQ